MHDRKQMRTPFSSKKAYYISRYFKFRYLAKILFSAGSANYKIVSFYYLSDNSSSRFFEKYKAAICRLLPFGLVLDQLELDPERMSAAGNSKQEGPAAAVYRESVDRIVEEIDRSVMRAKDSIFESLSGKLIMVRDDIRLLMKREIAFRIHNDVLLFEIARRLLSNRNSIFFGSNMNLLLEESGYWGRLVSKYASSRNVPVSFSFASGFSLRRNFVINLSYNLLCLVVRCINAFLGGEKGGPTKEPVKISIPHGFMDNFTSFVDKKNYYLFWYPAVKIDPERILIYYTGKIKDSSEIEKIRRMGFNILSCKQFLKKSNKFAPRYQSSYKLLGLSFEYLKELLRLLGKVRNSATYEEYKVLSIMILRLPYWEDFFTQNRIGIQFRCFEQFSEREIAARITGTTLICYNYSNYSEVSVLHQDMSDCFFTWGEEFVPLYANTDSNIRNVIQTGYSFDYTFAPLRKKSKVLRKQMTNSGAEFFIAIFDESLNVYKQFPALEYMRVNMLLLYQKLFKYAAENPGVGVVIKPKKVSAKGILKSIEGISRYYNILEEENRVKILDQDKYPVEAAAACDLAVGVHLSSSAILEGLLVGTPAIIFDCVRLAGVHPYYEWGGDMVVFDDIETTIRAIDKYRKNGKQFGGFGDWSPVLKKKDPFQDGRANYRVGSYIESLLFGLDSGLEKEEAILSANRFYGERFGVDKVVSRPYIPE